MIHWKIKKIWIGLSAVIFLCNNLFAGNTAHALNIIKGDVNGDGVFDVLDIITFQHWLLQDGISLQEWKNADFLNDDILNIYDLCFMKRALLSVQQNQKLVSDIEALFEAVRNAQPGDVIAIAPGTYDYSQYWDAQKIDISASGTKSAPIILKALDSENPPVLTGVSAENGYVLHITGDYWVLENLHITTSQKGIVLDHANHVTIKNCEICNTGSEAIAIRDGSSDCLIQDCNIHDSGLVTPGYGEGIYIGSSYTVTGFDYKCDNNKIEGCTFRNISAEHIDIKEYTTGTEISGCVFYGDGMSGENYAGSFIDIAGNNCNIHDNTGYRNHNPNIVAGFEIHEQVQGWGYHSRFENNILYMDREYGEIDASRRIYLVDGWFSDFTVKNNLIDYGNGLIPALPEHYHSDSMLFLES